MGNSLRGRESLVHGKNHELVQAEGHNVEGQQGNKQCSLVAIHAHIIAPDDLQKQQHRKLNERYRDISTVEGGLTVLQTQTPHLQFPAVLAIRPVVSQHFPQTVPEVFVHCPRRLLYHPRSVAVLGD